MSLADKPNTTSLNSEWTNFDDIVAALCLNEGTGTPVELKNASTVTLTGDQSWQTSVNGNGADAVRINSDATTLDFAISLAGDLTRATGLGAAGTIIVIYGNNTADTSNVARVWADSADGYELNRQGPSNTTIEIGNFTVGNVAVTDLFTQTGYHIAIVAWDNQTAAAGVGRKMWDNSATPVIEQDDTGGGANFTNDLNLGSVGDNTGIFQDMSIYGVVVLDVAWDDSDVTTFLSNEWAWLTGGGPGANPGLRIPVVDSGGTPLGDDTGYTVVVYDAVGGTELYETTSAAISSGDIEIDDDAFNSLLGNTVYVVIRKAGSPDREAFADLVVVDLNGTDNSDGS